jgi:DNA-binding GntR family transcriptional regulator
VDAVRPGQDEARFLLDPHIERVSTPDQVANILRRSILAGILRPGMPVPEQQVASELGVSRNSVREATRMLIPEGLLQHHMHRGVIVTEIGPDDVESIYQIRTIVESAAVEDAIGLAEEAFAELADAVDAMHRASDGGSEQAALENDMAFHRALVGLLDNRRLQAFHAGLQGELRLGMWLVTNVLDDLEQLASDHEAILRLLVDGRRDACLAAVRSHMEDARTRLTTLLNDPERRARRPYP